MDKSLRGSGLNTHMLTEMCYTVIENTERHNAVTNMTETHQTGKRNTCSTNHNQRDRVGAKSYRAFTQ